MAGNTVLDVHTGLGCRFKKESVDKKESVIRSFEIYADHRHSSCPDEKTSDVLVNASAPCFRPSSTSRDESLLVKNWCDKSDCDVIQVRGSTKLFLACWRWYRERWATHRFRVIWINSTLYTLLSIILSSGTVDSILITNKCNTVELRNVATNYLIKT